MNAGDGKPFTKVHASPKPSPEKPWAILGMSRKQCAATRHWKRKVMMKEKFTEMLNLIPPEATNMQQGTINE